jgi:hypothetical protein
VAEGKLSPSPKDALLIDQALASATAAAAVVTEAPAAAANLTASATADAAVNSTAIVTAAATATEATAAGGAPDGAAVDPSATGADFGNCDPTIKFEGGLGGRPGNSSDMIAFDLTNKS